MAASIRLGVGLGLDAPARARTWLREVCAVYGLDDLADGAGLMVGELVTNVVVHAGTECTIVAERGVHSLRVDVTDENPSDVRPVAVTADAADGLGLHIVQGLARTWGVQYQPNGKTVWFTYDDSVDAAPASAPMDGACPAGTQPQDVPRVRKHTKPHVVPAERTVGGRRR